MPEIRTINHYIGSLDEGETLEDVIDTLLWIKREYPDAYIERQEYDVPNIYYDTQVIISDEQLNIEKDLNVLECCLSDLNIEIWNIRSQPAPEESEIEIRVILKKDKPISQEELDAIDQANPQGDYWLSRDKCELTEKVVISVPDAELKWEESQTKLIELEKERLEIISQINNLEKKLGEFNE